MLAKLGSLLSLLAFPILCLNCISGDSVRIQAAIQTLVSTGLKGIPGITVKADGRDILLTGRVPSEADRAKAGSMALLMPGVRTVDNQLMIEPPKEVVQKQLNDILLAKKIEFETGKDVILPVSTPVLEEVLGVLNQAPHLTLKIEGHTDDVGNADKNRTLSQARAQAVVNWLSQKGVAKEKMSAAGLGPDKPIAPNTTPEGRAKNRRVEIVAN